MENAKSRGVRGIIIALILTGFFITVLQLFLNVIKEEYYINIIEVVVVTFFFVIIVGIYEFNKSVEQEEDRRERIKKIEI
jgi:uncharacterized membrane protein YqjE